MLEAAKVTAIVHELPGASRLPQALETLNPVVAVTDCICTGSPPVLATVTVWRLLELPANELKLREEGVIVNCATCAEAAIPVPERATVCGLPEALSEMLRVPL